MIQTHLTGIRSLHMIYCKLPEDKDDQAPIRFIVIYNGKIHDGLQYVLIFCTLPGAMKMTPLGLL